MDVRQNSWDSQWKKLRGFIFVRLKVHDSSAPFQPGHWSRRRSLPKRSLPPGPGNCAERKTPSNTRLGDSRFSHLDRSVSCVGTGKSPAARQRCDQQVEPGRQASWLVPVELQPKRRAVRITTTGRRASNRGCLQMSSADDLLRAEWTGRQIARGKRGQIPQRIPFLLDR